MKKKIIIIGGGISGLSLLHYLKQKYKSDQEVEILLLEKNDRLGGTIRSVVRDGCLFETGPNGFLDSKSRTLEFVKELDLEERLVKANAESSIRYLSVNNALHELPTSPKSFLSFKLLKFSEKLRILGEFFVPKGCDPDESVYDFGKRRLGEKFAQIFLDPMVSGVYGGDARNANLKAVFPKIYEMEDEHGSLFKAMFKIRKARKAQRHGGSSKSSSMGTPSGKLTSFQEGVAQMINALGQQYRENIQLNCNVRSISYAEDQFIVTANEGQRHSADELYVCAPAYASGSMLNSVNHRLSQALGKIHYAPIAVVGLVYPSKYFSKKPKGYGYLIPSSEQKEILGVLFEGNIFPGRCRDDQIFFRVMIGGARHPDILNKSKEELVNMASKEIEALFGKEKESSQPGGPKEHFFVPFTNAIPQYDLAYCELIKIIEQELQKIPNLRLVANYLKGVSLNDCIESAYQSAQKSSVLQK